MNLSDISRWQNRKPQAPTATWRHQIQNIRTKLPLWDLQKPVKSWQHPDKCKAKKRCVKMGTKMCGLVPTQEKTPNSWLLPWKRKKSGPLSSGLDFQGAAGGIGFCPAWCGGLWEPARQGCHSHRVTLVPQTYARGRQRGWAPEQQANLFNWEAYMHQPRDGPPGKFERSLKISSHADGWRSPLCEASL